MTSLNAEQKALKAFNTDGMESLNQFLATLDEKKASIWNDIFNARQQRASDKTLKYFFAEFQGMVFIEQRNNRFYVMGFKGKALKPSFYYYYDSESQMNDLINRWAIGQYKSLERKQESKDAKKERLNGLIEQIDIGAIFCSSWGYEQTNIDYFQVVGKKGKSTILEREIASEIVKENHNFSGEVIPVKDAFLKDSEIMEKRINCFGYCDGKPSIIFSVNSFANASIKYPNQDGTYSSDYYSSYY